VNADPTPAYSYGGVGRRAAACLIDVLLLGGFSLLLASSQVSRESASLLAMASFWAYFAILESSSAQATLGKHLMGLRVMTLRGQRIGFGQASLRYFAKLLSNLSFGLGYLIAAFTERQQTLHDLIARTVVIRL
jgi:uncharacterized RDD family membrane protein YckC